MILIFVFWGVFRIATGAGMTHDGMVLAGRAGTVSSARVFRAAQT